MQLEFAMLADAVLTTADRKIIIQGANVDNVRATAYPAVQPALALVAMFVQDPTDRAGDVHELRVEALTPTGEPWLPPIRGTVATAYSQEDQPAKSTAVVNFSMLVFPERGRYTFRLYLDDAPLREIYFYAIEVPQEGASSAPSQGAAPQRTSDSSEPPSEQRTAERRQTQL